jgi:hypothetical protein
MKDIAQGIAKTISVQRSYKGDIESYIVAHSLADNNIPAIHIDEYNVVTDPLISSEAA